MLVTPLNAYERGGYGAGDMYFNEKVPFGFNYVDRNLVIDHDSDYQGSHVAGIAAANRYVSQNGTFVDARDNVFICGVAPDARILTMKVFGNAAGPYDSDYVGAPGSHTNPTCTEQRGIPPTPVAAGQVRGFLRGRSGT